jgi:hypothetical protein
MGAHGNKPNNAAHDGPCASALFTMLKLFDARRRGWVAVGLALVGGLAAWHLWPNNPTPDAAPPHAAMPASAPVAAVQAEPVPPPAQAVVASESLPPAAAWADGFTTDDAYPLVRALHASRAPGAYAQAVELMRPCLVHHYLSTLATDQRRDANAPDYGVQLQAKQRLDSRCRRMDLMSVHMLLRPIAGDTHGERYRAAFDTLNRVRVPAGEREAALREMFAQGVPHEMVRRLADGHGWWRGQSWEGRAGDYAAAARLATWRSSTGAGAETADLRLVWECRATGRCAGRFDEEVTQLPEPRRSQVMALARDMEAAIRNRDATPFLAPAVPNAR